MVMSVQFAEQYGKPCIRIDGTESFEEVSMFCWECEAIFNDGEDDCYVVQFKDRPQELYTESALRRSLNHVGVWSDNAE
jgi:hypothetical protein